MSYYDQLFIRVGQLTLSVLILIGLVVVAKLIYDHVTRWYEAEFRSKESAELYDWGSHTKPVTYAGKNKSRWRDS